MMEESEKRLLAEIIQEQLINNWNTCDILKHGTEYDRLTDECSRLHKIIYKYDIQLPDHITHRF